MVRALPVVMLALVLGCSQGTRARNVILFVGDAGGIPTLNAASIHGHRDTQALFIQQMPHIGLSDTSAVDRWVTDSAAGMTAIVTGQKTRNGVISQGPDAVRGKADGAILKTILEHAEEHGLSTGVITNTSIADATPAACYAHANDRRKAGDIFAQVAKPPFGDGPELVIGGGRTAVLDATSKLGVNIQAALRERGYTWLDAPSALTADMTRVVALTDDAEFDLAPVVERAIGVLSKNRRGYFLMVEWDMHPTRLEQGLNRVLTMDKVIRQTASQVKDDTLMIFTADHSFDLRVRGGTKDEALLPPAPLEEAGSADDDEAKMPRATGQGARPAATPAAKPAATPAAKPGATAAATAGTTAATAQAAVPTTTATATAKPNVRVENGHTGEQVLVAARGPGAERVRGFIRNTDLFRIMMAAYGWEH